MATFGDIFRRWRRIVVVAAYYPRRLHDFLARRRAQTPFVAPPAAFFDFLLADTCRLIGTPFSTHDAGLDADAMRRKEHADAIAGEGFAFLYLVYCAFDEAIWRFDCALSFSAARQCNLFLPTRKCVLSLLRLKRQPHHFGRSKQRRAEMPPGIREKALPILCFRRILLRRRAYLFGMRLPHIAPR